jgi:hypothetical protein
MTDEAKREFRYWKRLELKKRYGKKVEEITEITPEEKLKIQIEK